MSLSDDLEKIVGKNAEQQEVKMWLDTGFVPLNKAISGSYKKGMPVGRIVEMFGDAQCGKTAIATNVMASAQRAGGIAAFMDHENSFDLSQGINLGLNPEDGWVYKLPETFEESIDQMIKLARAVREKRLIDPEAPIVAVFDSLASMVPQSKLYDSKGKEKDNAELSMHDNTALARCTAASFPALAQMANKYNILMLFLNQTRVKLGVTHGDATSTPGGKAPEFYASLRIKLTRSMLKDGKDIEGQSIRAYVTKNRFTTPFKEAHWRFMFREDGTGHFDTIRSTIDYAKDIGVLKASGAYVVWDGKNYHAGPLAKKLEEEGRFSELLDMIYATED